MRKAGGGPIDDLINRYFQELEKDKASLEGIPDSAPDFDKPKTFHRVLRQIHLHKAKVKIRRWQLAASLSALACLLSSLFIYYYYRDSPPGRRLVASTGYGEIKSLVLDDGSKIWLNSGSELYYPARFGKVAREVELNGEAYFEVKRDPARPFLIRTRQLATRVLGTSFNISAYQEEDNIRVSVVQGSVSVEASAEDLSSTPRLILTPNQEAIYSASRQSLLKEKVAASGSTAWREGKLVYRNTPLSEIAADLLRKYGKTVKLDKNLEKCAISADFGNDSLEKILKILEVLVGGEVIPQGNTYFLRGIGCRDE